MRTLVSHPRANNIQIYASVLKELCRVLLCIFIAYCETFYVHLTNRGNHNNHHLDCGRFMGYLLINLSIFSNIKLGIFSYANQLLHWLLLII